MSEYQYFYKDDQCKATLAMDDDCICWHDEGTGPFKNESRDDPVDIVNWRVKKTKKVEYHTNCHDCGQFVKKHERVAKDNPHKHHALCGECLSNYDCVECDNTM